MSRFLCFSSSIIFLPIRDNVLPFFAKIQEDLWKMFSFNAWSNSPLTFFVHIMGDIIFHEGYYWNRADAISNKICLCLLSIYWSLNIKRELQRHDHADKSMCHIQNLSTVQWALNDKTILFHMYLLKHNSNICTKHISIHTVCQSSLYSIFSLAHSPDGNSHRQVAVVAALWY